MTHDAAVLKAQEIASRVLAPSAGQNDKAGRFSTSLGRPYHAHIRMVTACESAPRNPG